MKMNFRVFWLDESGATVIEYALVASLISVAIVSTLHALGAEMVTMYGKVQAVMSAA